MKKCYFLYFIIFISCSWSAAQTKKIVPGAERLNLYKPALKNKTVALVANNASLVGQTHLLDTLLALGVKVKVVFCPEHGFRGNGSAGEYIKNSRDVKTGIPIISLYGKKMKPTHEDLAGVDVVFYDLQDVGVRFYTYISTLSYVMQSCVENFIPLFILDRPNPNGFYIDGPVLDVKYKSFVGLYPIPVVYGMTPGEFATMINEEGWLGTKEKCSLGIIQIQNYTHKTIYDLPVNPSPNLTNMKSVYLYPSLGFFEGTIVNVGRGTDFPFQVYGSPWMKNCDFNYTPQSKPGSSNHPPHEGQLCNGVDLRNISNDSLLAQKKLSLNYLIFAYENMPNKKIFFNTYFTNLAGNKKLQQQITDGKKEDEIRASWKASIDSFKIIRKKYLLYPDFE